MDGTKCYELRIRMRRNLTVPALLHLLSIVALLQRGGIGAQSVSNAVAADDAEKKITAVLEKMAREHQTYLSVPVQDGKALRLLTESAAAKNVVEIGTSTGYSGFCCAWRCGRRMGTSPRSRLIMKGRRQRGNIFGRLAWRAWSRSSKEMRMSKSRSSRARLMLRSLMRIKADIQII